MDTIVTGEAVQLDTRPAAAASRLVAALIDLVVLAVVVIVSLWALNAIGFALDSDRAPQILVIVLFATITVILPTTVDTLTRGRSLGKLAMGIRIVRDDGGPIVFRQAFVRALTGVVELWITFGLVALITSIAHPQGKRVGDILAGTYAARIRTASMARRPLPMPPHLATWAAHADVARLPDGLALSVRQFLMRSAMLHEGSRHELGTALTREVLAYVQPLPPAGVHPEDFLAAVLATRRERELVGGRRRLDRSEAESSVLHRLPHGVPDPAN